MYMYIMIDHDKLQNPEHNMLQPHNNSFYILYNNTPSNAIVNAASDITYRPVIEADDTCRCTKYMNFNFLLF
jgi:hypothetical protein